MPNVVAINPFEVSAGREAEALEVWERFAAYFRAQPGYVCTRLHRAAAPGARFHLVSVSEWASAEQFAAALSNPALREVAPGAMEAFPHYPGLYEVIRT